MWHSWWLRWNQNATCSNVSPWISCCQTILHLISLLYALVRISLHVEQVTILDNTTNIVLTVRKLRDYSHNLNFVSACSRARSRTTCSKFNFARFHKTTVQNYKIWTHAFLLLWSVWLLCSSSSVCIMFAHLEGSSSKEPMEPPLDLPLSMGIVLSLRSSSGYRGQYWVVLYVNKFK